MHDQQCQLADDHIRKHRRQRDASGSDGCVRTVELAPYQVQDIQTKHEAEQTDDDVDSVDAFPPQGRLRKGAVAQ